MLSHERECILWYIVLNKIKTINFGFVLPVHNFYNGYNLRFLTKFFSGLTHVVGIKLCFSFLPL